MPGHKGKTLLAKDECGRQQPHAECCSSPGSPGFSILSLMEPLCQAPFAIQQIIMSLCAVSIATCNKLCEIMTPFHGEKNNLESMLPWATQLLTGFLTWVLPLPA